MNQRLLSGFGISVVLVVLLLVWQSAATRAQQQVRESSPDESAQAGRFEFEVIESFDAKYLGDTPGHRGRSGGLGNRRPYLALGDTVFRGNDEIGTLTQIHWDRTGGSLDLEFDPMPTVQVHVGDVVWVKLESAKAPEQKR